MQIFYFLGTTLVLAQNVWANETPAPGNRTQDPNIARPTHTTHYFIFFLSPARTSFFCNVIFQESYDFVLYITA